MALHEEQKREAAEEEEAARNRAEEKMVQADIKLRKKEERAERAAQKKVEKAAKALEKEQKKKEREEKTRALVQTPRGKKRLRERSEAPEESNFHTCHHPLCLSQWYGDKDWQWCERCLIYGICPDHWTAVDGMGKRLMNFHESHCRASQSADPHPD